MLVRNRGIDPAVDPSAFVAPTAALVGRVAVGPRACVMYGAVLDSEASTVDVGECAIVCENAVLRATAVGERDLPVLVGNPLRVYAPGDEGLPEAIRSVNFARTAFGVRTAWEDRVARYRETVEVRSQEFGAHLQDAVLDPGR
jgi:hypothetical protein